MKTLEHYENHLAPYYSWIYGGFELKSKEAEDFFKLNNILPISNSIAIDLGAGNGFQSIPLALLGFKVTAIDFSSKLLKELSERKGNLPIQILEKNILDFDSYNAIEPELIICMGDTLTHLKNLDQVLLLLNNSYKLLANNGKLILGFRDLTFQLNEFDRFVPLAQSENQIFTCILEYDVTGYVRVNDLVYVKENNVWKKELSSYLKLVISPEIVIKNLKETGFKVLSNDKKLGMVTIIATK
jgi:SAM-dependent methyltransferase